MKHFYTSSKILMMLTITALFLSGCASTTVIESYPSGAKLIINGETVGTTPYTYTDTKILGSANYITLEKEGYKPLNTVFVRNEEVDAGAVIGGILVWVPFLWTMKYKPTHNYELISVTTSDQQSSVSVDQPQATNNKTKADKLRELKKLLDDKIITQEEFDKEKKKILDEK